VAQNCRTIGWFRENREVSCPFGTKVYLVTDELVRIINELEGAIGRLIRLAAITGVCRWTESGR
jgi:hypothetical protein